MLRAQTKTGVVSLTRLRASIIMLLLFCAVTVVLSQEVQLERTASPNFSVTLINLTDHKEYISDLGSFHFSVPSGPYLIRLQDSSAQQTYQEYEFIDEHSSHSRNLEPSRRLDTVIYEPQISKPLPLCSAIPTVVELLLERYEIYDISFSSILKQLGIDNYDPVRCGILDYYGYGEGLKSKSILGSKSSRATVSISFDRQFSHYYFSRNGIPAQHSRFIEDGVLRIISDTDQPSYSFIQCGISIVGPVFYTGYGECSDDARYNYNSLGYSSSFYIVTISVSTTQQTHPQAVNTPESKDNQVQSAGSNTDREIGKNAYSLIANIQDELLGGLIQLQTSNELQKPVSLRTGSQAEIKYYRTKDVLVLTEKADQSIYSGLASLGLSGFSNYYQERRKHINIPDTDYTQVSLASTFIHNISNLMDKLKLASNDLSVQIIFTTSPKDADGAKLTAFSGTDEIKAFFSPDLKSHLYRGLYSYQVQKAGFKQFSGRLDLVDDGPRITCILFKIGDPSNESHCGQQ